MGEKSKMLDKLHSIKKNEEMIFGLLFCRGFLVTLFLCLMTFSRIPESSLELFMFYEEQTNKILTH